MIVDRYVTTYPYRLACLTLVFERKTTMLKQ